MKAKNYPHRAKPDDTQNAHAQPCANASSSPSALAPHPHLVSQRAFHILPTSASTANFRCLFFKIKGHIYHSMCFLAI